MRQAVAAQAGSLAQEAIVLRAEVARLGTNLKTFELHAKKYNESPLHKSVNAAQAATSSSLSKTKNAGVQNKSDLDHSQQAHIENVAKLREEYAAHVEKYKAMADDYRKFYEAYADHWQRYQLLLEQCQSDNHKAQQSLVQSKKELAAVKNGEQVLKAEAGISDVLKRMFTLQARSPYLSESYLCPAYDDLHKEFVQAMGILETSVVAVPDDQRKEVAQAEITNLQVLKQQMTDAEELHDEQQLLQKQFTEILRDTNALHDEEKQLASPEPQ